MNWLAHLSKQRRKRDGTLTDANIHFAGEQARGDEFNSPTWYVIDVGRRFKIELEAYSEFSDGAAEVLVLLGEGPGQFKQLTAQQLLWAAQNGWHGLTLIGDRVHEPEMEDAIP